MLEVRDYLSAIGRRGGKKSRRVLTQEDAKRMVRIREAKRAYRKFHTQCFWSFDRDYPVTAKDIPWVARRLMTHGGKKGWELGAKLCS